MTQQSWHAGGIVDIIQVAYMDEPASCTVRITNVTLTGAFLSANVRCAGTTNRLSLGDRRHITFTWHCISLAFVDCLVDLQIQYSILDTKEKSVDYFTRTFGSKYRVLGIGYQSLKYRYLLGSNPNWTFHKYIILMLLHNNTNGCNKLSDLSFSLLLNELTKDHNIITYKNRGLLY